MDRRWQLVLDCLDTEQALFSKGTLVAFRRLLIKPRQKTPVFETLSFTHILQREARSKMSALKPGLQLEPALPQRFPARRAIVSTSKIATQTRDLDPKSAHGQG